MDAVRYVHVAIDGDRFTVTPMVHTPPHPVSGYTMLQRIETILTKKMLYANIRDDFSQLSPEDQRTKLRDFARLIEGRVPRESSCFTRLFNLDTASKALARIEHMVTPPSALPIPDRVTRHTLGFAEMRDIGRFAAVNRNGRDVARRALVLRARECGFAGDDVAQSREHLRTMTVFVNWIQIDDQTKDAIVKRSEGIFFNYINAEETYKRLMVLKQTPMTWQTTLVYDAVGSYRRNDVLPWAIRMGGRLDYQSPAWGDNPLRRACNNGSLTSVRTLLDAGVKADEEALATACRGSYEPHDIPRLLIERGAPVTTTVLRSTGNISLFRTLLQHNVRLETRADGATILHTAITNGNFDAARELLKAGADVNAINDQGRTPLMILMRFWWPQARDVQMLLDYGAATSINHVGPAGNSALHIAVEKDASEEIIQLLVAYGADTTLVNAQGQVPFDIASDKLKPFLFS